MTKTNKDGDYYQPINIDLWEFKWTSFITEDYKPDQKFIFVFYGNAGIGEGDAMILEYSDFMDNQHIKRVGVKYYRPINWVKL